MKNQFPTTNHPSKIAIEILAGQYYDSETGLHYNYHRYYDPRTGRYITPDPIGLVGGINLYTYSTSNPINAVDQFGLDAILLPRPLVMPRPMTLPKLPPNILVDPFLLPNPDGLYYQELDPDDVDLTDTETWPEPPSEGTCKEGEPSRSKPRKRGEKSLYDPEGGEWRIQKPDKHHPDMHWNYKPPGPNTPWRNIPLQPHGPIA